MLQRQPLLLTPDKEDIQFFRDAIRSPESAEGAVSRLFNNAKPDETLMVSLRKFYGEEKKEENKFQPMEMEKDEKTASHLTAHESVFNNEGKLQDWFYSAVPEGQRREIEEISKTLLNVAPSIILDKKGEFNPSLRTFLQGDLLDQAEGIFGKDKLYTQLCGAVRLCLATLLNQKFGIQSLEKTEVLLVILNHQTEITQNYINQINSLESSLKKSQKDNENKYTGYEELAKVTQKLIVDARIMFSSFCANLCQDPDDMIAKLEFTNAIYTLPTDTAIFSECVRLLNDATFMSNSADVKNLMKAITSISKYEAALLKLEKLDPISDICQNRKNILRKAYDELYSIIPAVDSFIIKTESSTKLITQLASFHHQLQSMNSEEKKSALYRKSKNLYETATKWIFNGLVSNTDFSDFDISFITDSLYHAGLLINSRNNSKFVNDEIDHLKKNSLIYDKLEHKKENYVVQEVPVDENQYEPRPFVPDKESYLPSGEGRNSSLQESKLEEFLDEEELQPSENEEYVDAVIEFIKSGADFTPESINTKIHQLSDEVVALVGDNIQPHDMRSKKSIFHRQLSVSDAELTILYHFQTKVSARPYNELIKEHGDETKLQASLDKQIAVVQELKKYNDALQSLDERGESKNNKKIVELKKAKLNQFIDLLDNESDLAEFTQSLKDANQLLLKLDNLKIATDEINLDPGLDKNKLENLKFIKKAGHEMYLQCGDIAVHLLKQHPPIKEDIEFLNNCLTQAEGAIKSRGTQAAAQYVEKLDTLAKEAPGKPSYGKKLSAIIKLLIGGVIIGLGIAGIPFTLGTSAAIGMSVGGGLIASGGAYLFYKGMRHGLSKKLHRLANELDKSHPDYIAPSYGSRMKGYFLNSVTRTKTTTAAAKPELASSIPEKLSESQQDLLKRVLEALAANKLTSELAEKIYNATYKAIPPENATLREFIVQEVVPYLSEKTLFTFAQAAMEVEYKRNSDTPLLRHTDILSTTLYSEFATRIKYSPGSQSQPDAMIMLNQMVLRDMERKTETKQNSSDSAAHAIFFKLKGAAPDHKSQEYQSLVGSLSNECKAVFNDNKPDELQKITYDKPIKKVAKEFNAKEVLNSVLDGLARALNRVEEDQPDYNKASKTLADAAREDCEQFNNVDNDVAKRKRQSHYQQILNKVIEAKDPNVRLAFMSLLISDCNPPHKFERSIPYNIALLSFIIQKAIIELKMNNREEHIYPIQREDLRANGSLLCERFKNDPVQLAQLATLLVKAAQACHKPQIKDELKKDIEKIGNDSPLKTLHESLSSIAEPPKRRSSILLSRGG